MSEHEKIDDRILVTPHVPTQDVPRLGAICSACHRRWDLGDMGLNLRDIKARTRHQCAATTEKQKEFPEIEPERTVTDPDSLKEKIRQARAERGLPSVNLGLGRR